MILGMEMKNLNVEITGDFGTPDFQKSYDESWKFDKVQGENTEVEYFADSEQISFLEIRKNLEIVARVDVVGLNTDERKVVKRRLLDKYPSGIVSHYWWWQPKGLKPIDFFENEADESIMMINVAFIEIYSGEAVVARVNTLEMNNDEEYETFERLGKKWRKCPKRVFRGEWPVNKRLTYFE